MAQPIRRSPRLNREFLRRTSSRLQGYCQVKSGEGDSKANKRSKLKRKASEDSVIYVKTTYDSWSSKNVPVIDLTDSCGSLANTPSVIESTNQNNKPDEESQNR